MIRTRLLFCVFAVAAGLSGLAQAQTKICLVDMAKVFKAHPTFNRQMEALKAEADQFQSDLQAAQQNIAKMNETLRTMDSTKPEYSDKEAEMTRTSTGLEVERRNKVRDLMQREAQIHYNAYASITQQIDQYCQQNGVPLVIRFNSDPMKADDPASVEQGFNNSVVYYESQHDITAEIIRRIAQASANPTH